MADSESWICSICLESNTYDKKYTLKPCDHTFHLECIIESLRRHGPKCPNCRNNPYENDNKNKNNINNIPPIFDIAGNDISNIFINRGNNEEDDSITDNNNDILDLSNLSDLSDISLSLLNIINLNN